MVKVMSASERAIQRMIKANPGILKVVQPRKKPKPKPKPKPTNSKRKRGR